MIQRYGFFRELRHGDPTGVSIKDSEGPVKERRRVADYLASGQVLVAAPGWANCLDPSCTAQLVFHVLTDGVWMWPMDLAHYVWHHGVVVPHAMLDRIETANYVPPVLTDTDLAMLEP